jgi:hypothetical protein
MPNISVDQTANSSIFNQRTFTNTATLTIGMFRVHLEFPTMLLLQATRAAGSIDRSTSSAISNSSGTFTNAAKLIIGIASVGNWGFQ